MSLIVKSDDIFMVGPCYPIKQHAAGQVVAAQVMHLAELLNPLEAPGLDVVARAIEQDHEIKRGHVQVRAAEPVGNQVALGVPIEVELRYKSVVEMLLL